MDFSEKLGNNKLKKKSLSGGVISIAKKVRGQESIYLPLMRNLDLTTSRIGNKFISCGKADNFSINLTYDIESLILNVSVVINPQLTLIWQDITDNRWEIIHDDLNLYIRWLQPIYATRVEYRLQPSSFILLKL